MSAFAAAALSVLPFLRAARHSFVSFDDPQMIEGNPLVRGDGAGSLPAAFVSFRMTSWQPLGWLLYAALDALGRGSPVPFHAASLLLHALNAGLAAALLERLLASLPKPPKPEIRAYAASVAVLFWAWHPVQTESVVWASQLSDLLCASFVLSALLVRENGRAWTGVVLFALAGLCRWKALSFVPFVLAMDFARGRFDKSLRSQYAAVALVASAVAAVNAAAKSGADYAASFRPHEFSAGLLWQLKKVVFPVGLAPSFLFDGGDNPLNLGLPAALAGLALFALAAVLVSRRRRFVGWPVAAFVAAALPPLLVLRPGAVPSYDHHLYLPLLAVAVLLAGALARATPPFRYAALPAVLLLGLLSFAQAGHWSDSETLWGRVLAVYPRSQTARYNLAVSRGSEGRWAESLLAVEAQLALFPGDRAAVDFRRILLERAAPTREARARLLSDAASLRFEDGDAAGAAAMLKEALSLSPRDPVLLVNMAIARGALGARGEARRLLEEALRVAPGHPAATDALARLEAAR